MERDETSIILVTYPFIPFGEAPFSKRKNYLIEGMLQTTLTGKGRDGIQCLLIGPHN